MPDIDVRITLSDFTLSGMHHVRGDMPLAEYLSTWLEIAHGHALEESIKAQRNKAYQRLAIGTDSYQKAIAEGKIAVSIPSNVKPFPGNDVTRRSPA